MHTVDKFEIQVAADLRAAGRRLADRVARSASSAEYRTNRPTVGCLPLTKLSCTLQSLPRKHGNDEPTTSNSINPGKKTQVQTSEFRQNKPFAL